MRRNLLILLLLPLLAGCGVFGKLFGPETTKTIRLEPPAFREVCLEPAAPVTPTEGTNLQQRVIAAGMVISVTVAEDASLNRNYTVPNNCSVDFAASGRLSVCGLTTDEVSAKIKTGLEKDYFTHATVLVAIESVVAPKEPGVSAGIVYVLGEVARPGPMQLPADTFTVTKAIIAAGGMSAFGRGSKVHVIRYCEDGRKYETYVNVSRIMEMGAFEDDVPLRPNDWVIVPQKWISFLLRMFANHRSAGRVMKELL